MSAREQRAHRRMTAAGVGAAIDGPRTRSRARAAPPQSVRYTADINAVYVVRMNNGVQFNVTRNMRVGGSVNPNWSNARIRSTVEARVRREVRQAGRHINTNSPTAGVVQQQGGSVNVTLLAIPAAGVGGQGWAMVNVPMRKAPEHAIWADAFVRYESDGLRRLTLTRPGQPVSAAAGNCVVTTLRKVYGLSERSVLRAIFDAETRKRKRLAAGGFEDRYEYEWDGHVYDHKDEGITTRMVSRFAERYRIPMIAVGLDGEAFYSYTPENVRRGKSMRTLFFAVSNGHMYFLDHHTKGLIRSFTSKRRVHLLEYRTQSEKTAPVQEPAVVHVDSCDAAAVAEKLIEMVNDEGTTGATQACVSGLNNLDAVLEDLVTRRNFIPSDITAYGREVGGFAVKSVEGKKIRVLITKDFELASQIPALRPISGTPPPQFLEFEGVIPPVYKGETLAAFGMRILDRSVSLRGISTYASTVSEEAWHRVFDKGFMPRAIYGRNVNVPAGADVNFDFAVDISKCYASALSDFGEGGVPVYSAFDRVEKRQDCVHCVHNDSGSQHGFWSAEEVDQETAWQGCCRGKVAEEWHGGCFERDRPGFWKVRTPAGAGFPFPEDGGIGWYATPVVSMAMDYGLIDDSQIEERYLASFKLPRDVFAKGVEFILTQFAGLPEAAKAMIMAYGKFGTREGRSSRVYVTCDPVEAGAILAKNPKASVFPMNVMPNADEFDRVNERQLDRDEALFSGAEWERVNFSVASALCDRGVGDVTRFDFMRREGRESYNVYQVHVPLESVYFRTKYPLYCYIVQMGWLKLIDMIHNYEMRYQVQWVAAKVDCAVFQYVDGGGGVPDIGGELGHDASLGLFRNMGKYKVCEPPRIAEDARVAVDAPEVDDVSFGAFRGSFGWDELSEEEGVEWTPWLEDEVMPLITGDDAKGFLLRGNAGTGKTSLVNKLLDMVSDAHPAYRFIKVAPTNKAALHIMGGTIDKVFGVYRDNEVNPTGVSYCERLRRFLRSYPEGETLVVVDEVSMCREDHYLTFLLVRALRPDVKFLMVGDFDQCPPVEPVVKFGPRGEFTGSFAGVRRREGALFDYERSDVMHGLVGGHRVTLRFPKRFDERLFAWVSHPSMSRTKSVRDACPEGPVRIEPYTLSSARWGLRWVSEPEDRCDRDVCWTNATRKFANWMHNGSRVTDAFQADATYQALEIVEDPTDPFTQSMILGKGVPMIAMKAWKLHHVVKNTTWKVTRVETKQNVLESLVRLRPDMANAEQVAGQNQQDGGVDVEIGPMNLTHVMQEIEMTALEVRSYFLLAYCLTTHRLQGDTLREQRIGIWEAGELARLGKFRILYTMLTRATALEHLRFYDQNTSGFRAVVNTYLNENPNAIDPFHHGFSANRRDRRGAGAADDEDAIAAQQGQHEDDLYASDEEDDFDDIE